MQGLRRKTFEQLLSLHWSAAAVPYRTRVLRVSRPAGASRRLHQLPMLSW